MYEKILVALDGSQLSEQILPYSRLLADKLKLAVELIHVLNPDLATPTSAAGQARYQDVLAAENEKGLVYLEKIAGSFALAAKIQCSVAPGNPAEVIVDKAAADRQTLIAMTTHGRSGINRWLIGSVADKVLHAAANPLLLVRAHEQQPSRPTELSYRRILVPLDGSPFAEQALDEAQAIAAATGATLVLVAVAPVVEDAALAEVGVVPAWAEAARQAEVEQLGRYLMSTAERLRAEGFMVRPHVVDGIPAEEILCASATQHADLIVMATHGRTGVQRLWIGSVATKVVRSTDVPVLLVRAQC
jgi:nucleotide-binding universal stress UspA family protein